MTVFSRTMAEGGRSADETIAALAGGYVACAADRRDEFHAVGAALAGSDEKAAAYQELLGNVVDMFEAVLRPIASSSGMELTRGCIGLVGAGDPLSGAVARGRSSIVEATATLASLIRTAVG